MKKFSFTLAAIISFLLIACGDSGGSSTDNINQPDQDTTYPYYDVDVKTQADIDTAITTDDSSTLTDDNSLLSDDSSLLTDDSSLITDDGAIAPDADTVVNASLWKAVSAGGTHTCGIKDADSKLYCWGGNGQSQIGDGTTQTKTTPTKIGDDTWLSVSSGGYHTCGIKTDNKIYCWGYNSSGQLGDGTKENKTAPTKIGDETWLSVSAGVFHTCAIHAADSKLYCWGYNQFGQIGDGTFGTTEIKTTPLKIGDDTWAAISAGGKFTCGKRTDNTIYCWGNNASGQLGDGSTGDIHIPTKVGTDTWASISTADGEYNNGQTCGIIAVDGTLFCWGNNANGQLGDGTTAEKHIATNIGTDSWSVIETGNLHTCGIKSADHKLYCWGYNGLGQIGDGTNGTTGDPYSADRHTPTKVNDDSWSFVTSGQGHTCGINADKKLYCWGDNTTGQVGEGTTNSKNVPTLVVN